MTLVQAIKAARRITILNGAMTLDINKKQAHELRRQANWVPEDEWFEDGAGDECHWKIESNHWLVMHWPQ